VVYYYRIIITSLSANHIAVFSYNYVIQVMMINNIFKDYMFFKLTTVTT